MSTIRTILLPTDFSECADAALAYAAQFARASNALIISLHAVEPLSPAMSYAGVAEPVPTAELNEQQEATAQEQLPRISEREELSGLEVEEIIVHGYAAQEIVRVAKERAVDLIVISSHGRTGLGRMLFGSTAEEVVRHAACPVLVVKPVKQ